MDPKKQLLAWCKNTMPNLRGCDPATQKRIKESLQKAGLMDVCNHERVRFVQSASGNESWYECNSCGEEVS